MNKWIIVFGAWLVLLTTAGCHNQKGISKCADNVSFGLLEDKLSAWVDSGYYDGIALQIRRNDSLLYEQNWGGYTDTTVLHVASAGKWIAAATLAAVVDAGLLSWDDPVDKYLPEFTDSKGKATLRQLFSHTSGFPDYQPVGRRKDDYQTLKEAVANIVDLPADTLPGTKFRYGGLAMQVAGRMAEIASGKDWETLFQENIAVPLAMTHSHFTPVSQEDGFSPMLGGGYFTCLRDYMHFLQMFANRGVYIGQRILSEQAIKAMTADQIRGAEVTQPEYVFRARGNTHEAIYGLGLWREELDDHGETVLISSPGWAGAYPWIDWKNQVYGFILAKVNVDSVTAGFSSFYGSAELPLLVRDALMPGN